MSKIKNKLKSSSGNIKMVFSNKRYFLLVAVAVFLFYAFNVLVGNIQTLISTYSIVGLLKTVGFYFTLIGEYAGVLKLSALIAMIITGALFGILFSLVVFRALVLQPGQKTNLGFITSIGLFFGAAAPGCAACGIGLLPLIGVSAASLSFFPFGGLELSVIAIFILIFSIVQFSEKMLVCSVNKK